MYYLFAFTNDKENALNLLVIQPLYFRGKGGWWWCSDVPA